MTNIVVNTTNINSVVNVTDLEVSVSVNLTNVESIVRVDYGLSDAPSDGKIYGRKDGAWIEITQQASGITDILEGTNINIDKTDPQNPIINIDETSTFTDTLITGLKSDVDGGEVPVTLYNWFKSVYASLVDSSVKSWIIGLITFVKSLTDRVTTLENDIINYSISVPEDVSAVDVTGINSPKGSVINLSIDFVYSVNTPASTYNMIFNDITTGYRNAGLSANNNIIIYSPLTEGSQYISTIAVSDYIAVNGLSIRKATGSNPAQLLLASSLLNFADSSITKITIRTTESGKVIAAGTKINLKVIK